MLPKCYPRQLAVSPARRAPLSSSKFRVEKGCLPVIIASSTEIVASLMPTLQDRRYLHHRRRLSLVLSTCGLSINGISLLTSTFHLPLMHSQARNSVSHSEFFQRHSSRDSHPSSS
jgi:hypothetical protein